MRMSDSSGQEAVMSQLANRRSLSVPGFRSTRSNLGVPVPISLPFRSNALFPADFGSPTTGTTSNVGTSFFPKLARD